MFKDDVGIPDGMLMIKVGGFWQKVREFEWFSGFNLKILAIKTSKLENLT